MKTSPIKKSIQHSRTPIFKRMAVMAVAMALAFGPGRALAQRPLGIDVSSYQGQPNWSSVKASGISFAWAKATEGTAIIDADFTYNQVNGKAAGVLMGAYHFARPEYNSPTAEAAYFWNQAAPYVKVDGLTLMPVLDFEVFRHHQVGAKSDSDWVNQWCNAIVADAAAQSVKVTPVLYVSACNACNFDSSVTQWIPWIANYNGENPQTGGPWNVCVNCGLWGVGVWTAWQYSSSGSVPGISGAVDLDVLGPSLSSVTVQ